MNALTRRLSAVLFSDIVAFTRLTANDDAGALRVVEAFQAAARECVGWQGGRVVRFVGDSVLAEFGSTDAAVRAGLALLDMFAQRTAAVGHPAELRVGVHVGELTEGADHDIYGESVNLAARVQAQAGPQQVVVSEDVWRQLRGRTEYRFEHLGVRELKGIAEPVPLYEVRLPGPAAAILSAPAAPADSLSAQGVGIRSVAGPGEGTATAMRLIVLPFRLLRPDPDIDFLAFGLADAITTSLSGLRSLIVRSSLTAQAYAAATVDMRTVARQADVDLVLAGTLLRVGERLRVTAQLTDATDGRMLWSETQQITMGDLFQLQDDLTQRIVGSLATPLSARDRRVLRGDVPATAKAFELYLKANELALRPASWAMARELYSAALAEDPSYAPAWARLGRIHRLLAKFGLDPEVVSRDRASAEQAFHRALELNADLPIAHSLYAQFQVESGQPREGMIRLLELIRVGGPNAEVYAGLVHLLRYCGLLDESLAAHQAARRIDPGVPTSLEFTLLALGRWEELLAVGRDTLGSPVGTALAVLGRYDEALTTLRRSHQQFEGLATRFSELQVAAIIAMRDGTPFRAGEEFRSLIAQFPDPEGKFVAARCIAGAGDAEVAADLLNEIVDGYYCDRQLRGDPWLAGVRRHASYPALVARATEGRERALTSFFEMSGPELLDPAPAA